MSRVTKFLKYYKLTCEVKVIKSYKTVNYCIVYQLELLQSAEVVIPLSAKPYLSSSLLHFLPTFGVSAAKQI
jgi:hypothetical protein